MAVNFFNDIEAQILEYAISWKRTGSVHHKNDFKEEQVVDWRDVLKTGD